MSIKELYLSMLLISVVFTAFIFIYYDTGNQYQKIGIAPTSLAISNTSLNKIESLTNSSNVLATQFLNQTDLSVIDYVSAIFKGGFAALQGFFNSVFVIFPSMISSVGQVIGIPGWVVGAAISAVLIVVILGIISIVLNKEI